MPEIGPLATLPNGTTVILPTMDYSAGTYNQNLNLSVGQKHIVATADRNNWPISPAVVAGMTVNISFDGGKTSQLLFSYATGGGVVNDFVTGQPLTTTTASIDVPQPSNPNRQITLIVTTYVTLNTSVAVTMS
jgi:hypothetical protein